MRRALEWYPYVFGFALLFAPTALAILTSARLSRRSAEEWRLLAWVPSAPLVLWWSYFAVSTVRHPGSHDLWPFEMALCLCLSLVLFGLFVVARKLVGGPSDDLRRRRRSGRGA